MNKKRSLPIVVATSMVLMLVSGCSLDQWEQNEISQADVAQQRSFSILGVAQLGTCTHVQLQYATPYSDPPVWNTVATAPLNDPSPDRIEVEQPFGTTQLGTFQITSQWNPNWFTLPQPGVPVPASYADLRIMCGSLALGTFEKQVGYSTPLACVADELEDPANQGVYVDATTVNGGLHLTFYGTTIFDRCGYNLGRSRMRYTVVN